MWTNTLQPRFSETDALGHVNNAVLPVWFEEARTPIFKLFSPGMDITDWHLIVAKIDVEFLAEIFYGKAVEIRTYLNKIGNSSMVVGHEAWQEGKIVSKGTAILVHFDHKAKVSKTIPETVRSTLEQHILESS